MKRFILIVIVLSFVSGCGGSSKSKPTSQKCSNNDKWSAVKKICTPNSPPLPPGPQKPTNPQLPEKHCSTYNRYTEWEVSSQEVNQYFRSLLLNNCNCIAHESVIRPTSVDTSNAERNYEIRYFSNVSKYDVDGIPIEF
jgi:hypothetical protein